MRASIYFPKYSRPTARALAMIVAMLLPACQKQGPDPSSNDGTVSSANDDDDSEESSTTNDDDDSEESSTTDDDDDSEESSATDDDDSTTGDENDCSNIIPTGTKEGEVIPNVIGQDIDGNMIALHDYCDYAVKIDVFAEW